MVGAERLFRFQNFFWSYPIVVEVEKWNVIFKNQIYVINCLMSKGLGSVERAIIDVLKKYESLPFQTLTVLACGYPLFQNYTRSDYNKVCRAVKSLKRKNLVTTNKITRKSFKYNDYLNYKRANWYILVTLKE